MEETPHIIAHLMAVGAEQRLENYHFLRNTYDTISGQELQLNRILRMLGEDEFALSWYVDLTPIGRSRSRSLYDFNRTGDGYVLPGNIAYERLRQMEEEDLKHRSSSQRPNRHNQYIRDRRKRLSEQRDASSLSNVHDKDKSTAPSRLRELSENDGSNDKLSEIELISFNVHYECLPSQSKNSKNESIFGRLLCQWALPGSSSGIDYYTIEYQLNNNEWLPIDEKIDKTYNQTELNISSLVNDENNQNIPACFRLKAHLNNGKNLTSKPTDKIYFNPIEDRSIIKPMVDILSANSVQLTWKNNDKDNINMYDVEIKEENETEWKKVTTIPYSQGTAQINDLKDAEKCQFRLVMSTSEQPVKSGDDIEPDLLTVHNVNEWLSSLRLVPTSANTIDVDISDEGFKEFDRYKVEYAIADQFEQWEQVPDITTDSPHLTIDNLQAGTDYKFRFTPILRGTTANETSSSQLSLVLDVKMPTTKKGRLIKGESKITKVPPRFALHQIDQTTVLIVAMVSNDEPPLFDDTFDVSYKNETIDSDWKKVGTIDKDHLSVFIKDLEQNTTYNFKVNNETLSLSNKKDNTIEEFRFETALVKVYDPKLFLEKVEQNLENVVNSVMRAAAGHQTLETPVNISLNEVIKEIFLDENLVPNEQYGFDTLALSSDLQLYCGPKQMFIQDLEVDETKESSKTHGEIIIHNYRQTQREQQPVLVREENGNTRIGGIDGDVIIRNVVTDVLLTNEETRNRLSMNIVGQAFLKGVQGILIASNFKGIIVVKTVNRP